MEDLASFIQTLSEKYGLLDLGNDKVENLGTNHLQEKCKPIVGELNVCGQHNGTGLDMDTSWECLTSFLNESDLQYANLHNSCTKRSSTLKLEKINDQLSHQGNVEETHSLIQPGSNSSSQNASLANTMQTSDLIQNASFLDELQNQSLSEDLQSTGMTKGQDSMDNHNHSSLLHEFLANNGEKDTDIMKFAKEMGFPSFDEDPQKEDATWHANSNTWFQRICSKRQNIIGSSHRSTKMNTIVCEEMCLDQGLLAHDLLTPNDILLSSESSGSPIGTELDGVEDCHSASTSQCGVDVAATTARLRCVSPKGFAVALESVERGRENAAVENESVEKMLEESNDPLGQGDQHVVESAHGRSKNRALDHIGKMSKSQFEMLENGSVGSLKQRVAKKDDGERLFLNHLDKSKSLLSSSKQPTLFRSCLSMSDVGDVERQLAQTRRSNEEVGDRFEEDDNVILGHLDEDGSMIFFHHGQEKVAIPLKNNLHKETSSRREKGFKPNNRASPIQMGQECGCSTKASYYSDQRREVSRTQEIDYQPSIGSSGDHVHKFDVKGDFAKEQKIGHNLKIRIPRFHPIADQYDPRLDSQELQEIQEGFCNSREMLTQDHQHSEYHAISPRDKQSNDKKEEFEASQSSLLHLDQNHQNDEVFCARSKEYYNFTNSWENNLIEIEEEEVIETIDPIPNKVFVGQSKWEQMNNVLCQNGFPTIRCSNISVFDFEEDCHLALSKILSNYERREKLVQALLEEGDELRQMEERNHMHIQQLETKMDEAKQKLVVTKQQAEVAAKIAERNCTSLRQDCQKLESSNANLVQRCSQLEHACRAKERTLQKLQDKVRESMLKEDRHWTKNKDVYEKLKHKIASAQHTNGEILEPNFLQRELKPAQIVGIYEQQKVVLENEISNLRAENAQLCREICEKENIILNKVLGTEETKKALELLSCKQQSQIDEKVKEICRLEDELKQRPTMEEVEETIRSASHQEEASRQLYNHALDDSYFEHILRQICELLELEEPAFIVETLESLLVLVSAVPRMEQFVSEVCDVVFCDGQKWSLPSNDEDNGSNKIPEAIPGILKSWLQKLDKSSELFTFKDTIVRMLWERADNNIEPEPEMSIRVVTGCVKNLIDVEHDYLATKASFSNADAIVKAEPHKLLQRIIAHFQMLFEIPKLEDVMAVMNSVYIKCTEYHNFAQALSSMLGLDKEEGPNTIISAVNSILSRGRD